jgi:hypothetical protein
MEKLFLFIVCLSFCSYSIPGYGKQPTPNELTIKVLKDLHFGAIKAGGVSGSITVSPSKPALVTTTGGVYSVHGQHQKATRLKLKGEKNTLVFLNLQSRTLLVSKDGKKLDLDLVLNSPLRHLGRSGVITDVFIGGTLHVDANPSAGNYKGDFSITVDYQ